MTSTGRSSAPTAQIGITRVIDDRYAETSDEADDVDRLHRVLSPSIVIPLLLVAVVLLSVASLLWSSVSIPVSEVIDILFGGEASKPAWRTIILELRLPRTLTAIFVGSGLGVAGLMLQTVFRNPLADPFIMGVSSGAGLGVALVVLGAGTAVDTFAVTGWLRGLGVVAAAWAGALTVLGVMLAVAAWVRDNSIVLLLGVMVAAFIEAMVTILVFFADKEKTRAFVQWSLGSFQGVRSAEVPILGCVVTVGLLGTISLAKPLNAMLLGERYARSLGANVSTTRIAVLTAASLIAASVVAYAGPIAFLGIAVPHLARGTLRTSDHRILVPGSALVGAALALACGLLAEFPGSAIALPINAATALLGAPVVVWVLLRMRRGLAS